MPLRMKTGSQFRKGIWQVKEKGAPLLAALCKLTMGLKKGPRIKDPRVRVKEKIEH